MNTQNKLLGFAVLVAFVFATQTCYADLVNGDFEMAVNPPGFDAPNFTDWDGWVEIDGTAPVVGWVEGNNFGGVDAPDSGDSGVIMANLAALNAIEQSFTTIPGLEYTVSYALGGLGGAFSPDWVAELEVSADGVVFDTRMVSQTAGSPGFFNNVSASFVATGSTTTLRFENTVDNTVDDFGIVIDNVSVSAIPEPGSAAIIGTGLIALCGRRRKK